MDFLKELALPQSLEHYRLVAFLATITALVFIPYVGFTLGTSVLSLWYGRTGRAAGDSIKVQFARRLSDLPLSDNRLVVFLAVIPGISLVLSYAQLLYGTDSAAPGLALIGFVVLAAGFILLRRYRSAFLMQALIESVGQRRIPSSVEMEKFTLDAARAYHRSGHYGAACVAVGLFLYAAAGVIAEYPATWDPFASTVSVFFSLAVWARFLSFLCVAAGVTGLGATFYLREREKGRVNSDSSVAACAERVGRRLSVTAFLALPALALVNLAWAPPAAVTGWPYALAGLAFVFLFIAAHFEYARRTTNRPKSAAYALVCFLGGAWLLIVGDNVILSGGTTPHDVVLASVHERTLEDLGSRLGVAAPSPTGEEIYTAKCSACHLFDQKKVGPPYFETIPKYAQKKTELISFIMSPRKINPAYPSMPGQGLRPSEADSIASYIMRKVAAAGKI